MVDGNEAALTAVMPILELMGTNIRRQGGPGEGQHTKLANQIVIAGTMLGVSEGLAYAERVALDPHRVLASIDIGAAGSFLLNNLGPKIIDRDFAAGFFVEHFLKDLTIASVEADTAGLALKVLQTAAKQCADLAANGGLRDGTQAPVQELPGKGRVKQARGNFTLGRVMVSSDGRIGFWLCHATCDEYLYVFSGLGTFWMKAPSTKGTFEPGRLQREPTDIIFVDPKDGTPETFMARNAQDDLNGPRAISRRQHGKGSNTLRASSEGRPKVLL
jgi:hypothetical protein